MIIPPHLAIKSLRDNGYKNAASAIAELMDNSIQHGASQVELICIEKDERVKQRVRSRLEQIAVIDNGSGMDSDVLYKALQFGNGTNLEFEMQTSMGKFGMGLPSSSISQARKVEVWTWQKGIKSALYSYLDVSEIENQKLTDVPDPIIMAIPSELLEMSKVIEGSKSGTIVLWSELDRCNWKTAKSIFKHSEDLIGRMYRYFINEDSVQINLLSYNKQNHGKVLTDKLAKANDPLYLMKNTSCPKPFHNVEMFQDWGGEIPYEVEYGGVKSVVKVKYSYAKAESRKSDSGQGAGRQPHGKHAKKNIGISILRANRELFLDKSLVLGYDPRERWWGCEISFTPELDEVFGVTNNKQFASNFSEVAAVIKSISDNEVSKQEILDEFDEDDPKFLLVDLILEINEKIKTIRGLIKSQNVGSVSTKKRHGSDEPSTAEDKAKNAVEKRNSEGKVGESDKNKSVDEVGVDVVKTELEQKGFNKDQIEPFLGSEKFILRNANLDTDAFFSVNIEYDKILVQLNNSHPAYTNLIEILDDTEISSEMKVEERLEKASMGLKLLLLSWARYEDEQVDKFRDRVKQVRREWGKVALDFLDNDDD
jgi:hypothetical protein